MSRTRLLRPARTSRVVPGAHGLGKPSLKYSGCHGLGTLAKLLTRVEKEDLELRLEGGAL